MGFLDKLKDFVKPNCPTNLSDAALLRHFASTMSGLFKARLEEMENWLDDTDVKLTELFSDYAVVTARD